MGTDPRGLKSFRYPLGRRRRFLRCLVRGQAAHGGYDVLGRCMLLAGAVFGFFFPRLKGDVRSEDSRDPHLDALPEHSQEERSPNGTMLSLRRIASWIPSGRKSSPSWAYEGQTVSAPAVPGLRGPNGLSPSCAWPTRAKRTQPRQDGPGVTTLCVDHPGIHGRIEESLGTSSCRAYRGLETVCVARPLRLSP